MDSVRISSIQAPPSLPASASPPPPVIQHLPFPFVALFCALAAFLRIAAKSKKAPPSSDGFLESFPVPWLWARIRLRRKHWQQIPVAPLCNGFPPDLPPYRDPVQSGLFKFTRFPVWLLQMCACPDLVPAPMESGEVLKLPQLRKIDPMGSHIRARELSRSMDQAASLNQAVFPSRAGYLDQDGESNQAFISHIYCPSPALFGAFGVFDVWELIRKMGHNSKLELRDEIDGAHCVEPKKKRGAEKEFQEEDQEVQFFEPLEQA